MRELTFPIALKGLATEFAESEQPLDFARELENRFINIYGSAEKRPGMAKTNEGLARVVLRTEYIDKSGDSIDIYIDTDRTIQFYNASTEAYEVLTQPSEVNTSSLLEHDMNYVVDDTTVGQMYAEQFNDKLIFHNKTMYPIYYDGTNQLKRLRPLLSRGVTTSGSNTTILKDDDVVNWLTDTNVTLNDLVYNATKGGYGVVTSVGANNIDHTAIGSAALAMGLATQGNQGVGDVYEIYDLRELNLFSQSSLVDLKDNVAIAGPGTTSDTIAVSGVNFGRTDLLPGDYIYNTTRGAVTRVGNNSAVSNSDTNITLLSTQGAFVTSANCVSGQAAGDSLIFLKSALPPFVKAHTHYGRFYGIDAREKSKVRVSGPDDPQDFSTFDDTLDANAVNYGARQGQGEELLTIDTFQKYLVVGGKKNVYLSEGTDPIQDTSADSISFVPVGLFSQGCVSNLSLANIGSNMLFAANDGMRSFNILDVLQVQTDNISEVIKTELRTAIRSNLEIPENLQVIHYPRRNWVLFKVGTTIYNFNYTPIYQQGQLAAGGTWSKFTGRLAECDCFLVKRDGSLVTSYYDSSAQTSTFYEVDTGFYDDDGTVIETNYKTAWIIPSGDGIVSDGRYIKPFFENAADQVYNVTALCDLEQSLPQDSVIVSASGGPVIGNWVIGVDPIGGRKVTNELKYPLRWRGEQVQIAMGTDSGIGADAISKLVIYTNTFGRK